MSWSRTRTFGSEGHWSVRCWRLRRSRPRERVRIPTPGSTPASEGPGAAALRYAIRDPALVSRAGREVRRAHSRFGQALDDPRRRHADHQSREPGRRSGYRAQHISAPGLSAGCEGRSESSGTHRPARAAQFNDAIFSLHRLIGPLEDLLHVTSSPSAHLARLISGAAVTTRALASVSPTISALLADGASTFAAADRAGTALGSTIEQLPGTESAGTAVFRRAHPVLEQAAVLIQDLKPGVSAAAARGSAARLDRLGDATPVFRRAPGLASRVQSALGADPVAGPDARG